MTSPVLFSSPISHWFVFLIRPRPRTFQDECLHHREVYVRLLRRNKTDYINEFKSKKKTFRHVPRQNAKCVSVCVCVWTGKCMCVFVRMCVCVFVWWAVTNMHGYRYRYFICFLLQFKERRLTDCPSTGLLHAVFMFSSCCVAVAPADLAPLRKLILVKCQKVNYFF